MPAVASKADVLPLPPSVDDMEIFIGEAKREYQNQKSSALKSAANAYLTWHWGESDAAEPKMRQWLDSQIETANGAIDQANSDVENLKRRAAELAKGTLNEKLSDEEEAFLTEAHKRDPKQWAAAKQVKIDARTGANKFTRIVKFVFGFVKPSDASLVSRYAKVLEYIERRKNDLNGEYTVNAIVKLLDAAGGFEAAIDDVRNPEAANDDKLRAATLTKIKEAMDRVHDGAEIMLTPKYETNGYVFLVGRSTATGVAVCGELAISNDNEVEDLLFKVDEKVMGTADPTVDFMARVVSIGELIREGREGTVTKDGTKNGEKHKVARTYSLTNFTGQQKMVVSARYTDASAVIHATPKATVTVGTIDKGKGLLLDPLSSVNATKLFGNAPRRLLMSITAGSEGPDAPLYWEVVTEFTSEQDTKHFAWVSMYDQETCPIDMRCFEPNSAIQLNNAALRQVYNGSLQKWVSAKKDAKTVNKALKISFDGVDLTMGHELFETATYPLGKTRSASMALHMRPRDVVDLFRKLVELNVQDLTLRGDANGLLAAEWEDEVGSYTIYLPAVDKRGGLSPACLGFMKPTK